MERQESEPQIKTWRQLTKDEERRRSEEEARKAEEERLRREEFKRRQIIILKNRKNKNLTRRTIRTGNGSNIIERNDYKVPVSTDALPVATTSNHGSQMARPWVPSPPVRSKVANMNPDIKYVGNKLTITNHACCC